MIIIVHSGTPIVHFDEQSLLLLKCSGEAFFVAQIPQFSRIFALFFWWFEKIV